MASFDESIKTVLANEGGLVDNPADPGGLTNWGISQRAYPNLDIRNLTREQAIAIYRRDYWFPLYDQIASQGLARKILDLGVNMGTVTAVRLLQRGLGYLCAGPVVEDGNFGPRTLDFVNGADEQRLLQELRARAAKKHHDIAVANVDAERFILGWFRRDAQ